MRSPCGCASLTPFIILKVSIEPPSARSFRPLVIGSRGTLSKEYRIHSVGGKANPLAHLLSAAYTFRRITQYILPSCPIRKCTLHFPLLLPYGCSCKVIRLCQAHSGGNSRYSATRLLLTLDFTSISNFYPTTRVRALCCACISHTSLVTPATRQTRVIQVTAVLTTWRKCLDTL